MLNYYIYIHLNELISWNYKYVGFSTQLIWNINNPPKFPKFNLKKL